MTQEEKEHKHNWLLSASAHMETPAEEQVIVCIWECPDCQEQETTWGFQI